MRERAPACEWVRAFTRLATCLAANNGGFSRDSPHPLARACVIAYMHAYIGETAIPHWRYSPAHGCAQIDTDCAHSCDEEKCPDAAICATCRGHLCDGCTHIVRIFTFAENPCGHEYALVLSELFWRDC